MSKTIQMPTLSPTMEEGTLARWLVKEGDRFAPGDILAEIETDKATMEIEAEEEGVITRIVIGDGTADVKVGTVIASFDKADTLTTPAVVESPRVKEEAPAPATLEVPEPPQPESPKASPLARRVAETKGIELEGIEGSGPGGRIVCGDVEERADASERDGGTKLAVTSDAPFESVTLSGMRKTIARRLTQAKQEIPHIYLSLDINLGKLFALRSEVNAHLEASGKRLSVNDFMIKALALALTEIPECNVQFAGDQLLKFQRADISVAVSIPGGLITPIVVGAEAKGTAAISDEMKDLVDRAKAGRLAPAEYQGGTASLSNMGMYGIRQFQAVINPPQAMIMAIGAAEARPVVEERTIVAATMMSATGSFDHRVIDGADGARLMQAFKALIENPLRILA